MKNVFTLKFSIFLHYMAVVNIVVVVLVAVAQAKGI